MARPELPDIPLAADERTMLQAFLDFYRAALIDRAWGLDHAQLQQQHPPTTLTLARLIGHMAMVEDSWFRHRLDGEAPLSIWTELDWDADPDAEMTLAETWSVEELMTRFAEAAEDASRRIAAASSLDQLSVETSADGEQWSLRWIMVHMIEEYARHCGHADLIREAIDGDSES